MEISLKGKVAVVTGGTRGIGYAIVKKYLEAGATVVLCGSKQSTAEAAFAKVKEELPEADVYAIAPSLADTAAVEEAFKWVFEKFGRFDILANNAGISQSTPLVDYTDEEVDRIMDLNIKAVFVCARAAARIMKENGGGVIVNTSSVVSIYGQPSGCLSRELAKFGIRVNAVAPGITRTDMVANLPEAMIKPLIARIPIGRMCEPEDVANAFLFLSSELASYITGVVVPVDGAVVI